jgi:hypothetical protein
METRVCEACYRVVFALSSERIGAAWAGWKAVELSVNSSVQTLLSVHKFKLRNYGLRQFPKYREDEIMTF